MSQYLFPVLFTLAVWWVSTGVILYLDGRPRPTYRASMAGATLVLAAALYGLFATRADESVAGAYAAFTCSVLVWGWVEMAFLMGFVTGPRDTPCPPDARGWARVGYALQAILYHEFALIAAGAAIGALTFGGSNPVGIWTFAILWVMRLSAKLNVFLGVRNLSEEFLPPHLRYLQTYFRRAPMNALFPVSVVAGTAASLFAWSQALASAGVPFEAASFTFAATLLTLGTLEHWFLVLPMPTSALWNPYMRSRELPPVAGPP